MINYQAIIHEGWNAYNSKRTIATIDDVSANVSTNKVFRIGFDDNTEVLVKVSNFGTYENFKEDHTIINCMANNLEYPYDLFLSSSLMKKNELFLYKYEDASIEVWMVFYRKVRIAGKLPKRLNEEQITTLGTELAKFHKVCYTMMPVLPQSSKTLQKDIMKLMRRVEKDSDNRRFHNQHGLIMEHCETFLRKLQTLEFYNFIQIPVFVDWNIGNFTVTDESTFFSRWDYDWFRMTSRMMDFYSFSRVVSDIGDKTDFSYTSTQLCEERFIRFLQAYHKEFPLTRNEILFLPEAYRFFILHYVISYGTYFFTESYAKKLQTEAYQLYLPQLDSEWNAEPILQALGL
ncbi:MAG: hypothetical protein FWC39_05455 [Bacteroidetes bacterium]|nr:hypothetical protein [Bacteroidota bacterium]